MLFAVKKKTRIMSAMSVICMRLHFWEKYILMENLRFVSTWTPFSEWYYHTTGIYIAKDDDYHFFDIFICIIYAWNRVGFYSWKSSLTQAHLRFLNRYNNNKNLAYTDTARRCCWYLLTQDDILIKEPWRTSRLILCTSSWIILR